MCVCVSACACVCACRRMRERVCVRMCVRMCVLVCVLVCQCVLVLGGGGGETGSAQNYSNTELTASLLKPNSEYTRKVKKNTGFFFMGHYKITGQSCRFG